MRIKGSTKAIDKNGYPIPRSERITHLKILEFIILKKKKIEINLLVLHV